MSTDTTKLLNYQRHFLFAAIINYLLSYECRHKEHNEEIYEDAQQNA